MRIFFVGGPSTDPRSLEPGEWVSLCGTIGRRIAQGSHDLLVCSSYHRGADRWVLDGFVAAAGCAERLHIFPPKRPESVVAEWDELLAELDVVTANMSPVDGPDASNAETRSSAYLLAQLRALDECELVIAVGGHHEGSASVLLHIAEANGTPVLPFGFAGGTAEIALQRLRAPLVHALGDDHPLLRQSQGIERCTEFAERLRNPRRGEQPYVFISHSWDRPAHTDHVEVELRRYENVRVFRDEQEIAPGADITAEIRDALERCTHFVGLWCTEYACSPHCFDEFHTIMERKAVDDGLKVLMLRLDETRLVWRAMRGSGMPNWSRVRSRSELRQELARFVGVSR